MSYFDRRDDVVTHLPRSAFRTSPIFLVIVAVFVASGVLAWRDLGSSRLSVFLFVISGWLISLCLHEYAHALVAFKAGDAGVAHRGYLQLNPLKYTNPFLSFIFPLLVLIIGGIPLPGGSVMIDHSHVRSRRMDSLISLAGPAMNVVFAIILCLPFAFGVDVAAHLSFWAAVALLGMLQMVAAVLNLLPVPGLDGGNALEPWLTDQWRRGFAAVRPYGVFLAVALIWQPRVNAVFFNLVDHLTSALGMPEDLWSYGYSLFRFWT